MEYIPETIYRVLKHYNKMKQPVPNLLVKLYAYQTFRALSYIHALGYCHRDIKPQNLLVNPESHTLKICDFGSAKRLVKGEVNVSYICSRYYRAPELIFGGTPTKEQIHSMNPSYSEFKVPAIRQQNWSKVFRSRTPKEAVDLISHLLVYSPVKRYSPLEAIMHPFFDELRVEGTTLPNGNPLPELFNFAKEELMSATPETVQRLIPDWFRFKLEAQRAGAAD